ncbi:hypothetical protein LCGC14_2939300, partial [marine sediment metagenome]
KKTDKIFVGKKPYNHHHQRLEWSCGDCEDGGSAELTEVIE